MRFYEALEAYYDILFPAAPAAVAFIAARVKPGGGILDAACGTGNHAAALAARGFRVVGVDLEPSMIARARAKRIPGGAVFLAGDMRMLSALMRGLPAPGPGRFDAVICRGNSLAHLASTAEIGRVLGGMRALLAEGGRLIVQVANFDRVTGGEPFVMPSIRRDREGVSLLRRYEPGADPGTVDFVATLQTPNGAALVNRVPLSIITRATLAALLAAAGFEEADWHGSFDGIPHSPEAPGLIVCATARG